MEERQKVNINNRKSLLLDIYKISFCVKYDFPLGLNVSITIAIGVFALKPDNS